MTLAGWCLLCAGAGTMVLSSLAAWAVSGVLDRLHLLTVTTSLGAPLAGLGLAIELGVGLAAAMVVVITVVVMLTAPVMSSATARLTAQYAGVVRADTPP